MKRNLLISVLTIALSIGIATFSNLKVNDAFLNTIYTLSGIMFSIGMGVICTFNPERIRNNSFLREIRFDIAIIRSSYIIFFSLSSALYLLNQLFSDFTACYDNEYYQICGNLPIATVAFSVCGIVYYINNFLAIQKLNFQITDRINSEN